jgi:hypothetical protein
MPCWGELIGLRILQNLPVPLFVLLTVQFIQSLVLSVIAIFACLYFAKKVGLGLPILEGWLEGKSVKDYFISILPIFIGLRILAGVLIIGLEYLFSFAGAKINIHCFRDLEYMVIRQTIQKYS